MIVTTVERIEELLGEAGYLSPVPLDSKLFAAGDGDVIEDAPTGYYRFHYWKSEQQAKEHENWLGVGREAGPMCVSIIRGSSGTGGGYYRLLIRTVFGFKSMILSDEVLSGIFPAGRQPSSHQLLTIAMHHYVGNEREKAIFATLDEDDGGASVRSGMSGMSTRSNRTRFLPHSRLKGSSSLTAAVKGSLNHEDGANQTTDARRDSIRRVSSTTSSSSSSPLKSSVGYSSSPMTSSLFDDHSSSSSSELIGRFRAFAKMKPSELARLFQRCEDPALAPRLLAMEQSLVPSKLDVDIIRCTAAAGTTGGNDSANWEAFCQLLGSQVEPGVLMQQRLRLARLDASLPTLVEPSQKTKQMSLSEAAKAQSHPVNDLVEKELNYSQQLGSLETHFVNELASSKSSSGAGTNIITSYQHSRLFGNLAKLAKLHRDLVKRINVRLPDGRIDVESMSRSLIDFLRGSKDARDAYQHYCLGQADRAAALREELERNQSFGQFCENIHERRIFGLARLDQLLMGPVQRMTRYKMHLEDIIRVTHPEDESLPLLKEALQAASSLALYIDSVVEQQAGLQELLSLAQRLKGLPASFLTKRSLVSRLEVVSEDHHRQEYELILLNDALMITRRSSTDQRNSSNSTSSSKQKSKKMGYLSRTDISAVSVQEFLLAAPLQAIKLTQQGRYLELILDDPTDPADGGKTFYRFTLKNTDDANSIKSKNFLSDLATLRTEQECKDSQDTKILYHANSPSGDMQQQAEIYFHLHPSLEAYMTGGGRKNRIALIYLDGLDPPSPSDMMGIQCQALGVIQVRAGSFRSNLRYRGLLYSSDACFTASKEFQPAARFRVPFLRALGNCGRLLHIYPPFPQQLLRQRQQQLESLSAFITDPTKLSSRLKSGLSKLVKQSSSTSKKGAEADDLAQRLWDDSMSYLAASLDRVSITSGDDRSPDDHQDEEEEQDATPRSVFGLPQGISRTPSGPQLGKKKSFVKMASPLAFAHSDAHEFIDPFQ